MHICAQTDRFNISYSRRTIQLNVTGQKAPNKPFACSTWAAVASVRYNIVLDAVEEDRLEERDSMLCILLLSILLGKKKQPPRVHTPSVLLSLITTVSLKKCDASSTSTD